uniref:Uncharacterized protein n=1 Tax=Globisporangium ultimum (strain ATCC 200006 / CBS 805.95 / DAOM BR144) TaxID=431595 RepID=K3W5L7_GLOUD
MYKMSVTIYDHEIAHDEARAEERVDHERRVLRGHVGCWERRPRSARTWTVASRRAASLAVDSRAARYATTAAPRTSMALVADGNPFRRTMALRKRSRDDSISANEPPRKRNNERRSPTVEPQEEENPRFRDRKADEKQEDDVLDAPIDDEQQGNDGQ